jgi:hypothetical protein
MRHFVERTSFEFDLVIDSDPLWHRDAVQASCSFPFLRHALMALSGLHICHMSPPQPYGYYSLACQHSVRASELFRNGISDITEDNWQPILTFLSASVAFNLDVSFLAHTVRNSNHSITPASMLLILRKPGLLSTRHISRLVSGPLAATLLRRRNLFRVPVNEDVMHAIQSLAGFCNAELCFSPNTQVYSDAVKSLETWADMVSCQPRSWQGLVGWSVAISDEYINLLQHGDEFAVVLFVYWCAVMNRAPDKYYLVGIMKKAEEIATAELDPSWSSLLEWPRKELQARPGILLG